jgi:hypothetical protein
MAATTRGTIIPINRKQWCEKFVELPHWPCPTCREGYLIPLRDEDMTQETGFSLSSRNDEDWEPEWIEARFAGFIKCSGPACGEVASISGNAPVRVFYPQNEYNQSQTDSNFYVVKSIFPAPIPINLPKAVPDIIEEAIIAASALVWVSSEAAGNQLRQVVELFLTDASIPAKATTGRVISAHSRIEQFQRNDPENGDALLAVKWLGNSSSHPGGLSRDDVLDAFDIIESVLENRYGTTKPALKAKIAEINAHKGPAKKASLRRS